MDLNDYKKQALRTDYADYTDFHTGDASPRLDYASTGLVTESVKVLDLIKKSKKALVTLDKEKVKEELGDLLWYFNLTLDELNISFDEIMENSIAKINRKHPEGDPIIRGDKE